MKSREATSFLGLLGAFAFFSEIMAQAGEVENDSSCLQRSCPDFETGIVPRDLVPTG
jgi:hypothetical protein